MSVKVSSLVWERLNATGGKLLLALAIADHSNDSGGSIFPGIATLAAKTRQDERTVQRQIKRFMTVGWLELVRDSVGGRYRTREYRISTVWINGGKLPGFPDIEGRRKASRIPETPAIDPRNPGKLVSPNPSLTIKNLQSDDSPSHDPARARRSSAGMRRGLAREERSIEARTTSAITLIRTVPDTPDEDLMTMYGLDAAQIAAAKRSARQEEGDRD